MVSVEYSNEKPQGVQKGSAKNPETPQSKTHNPTVTPNKGNNSSGDDASRKDNLEGRTKDTPTTETTKNTVSGSRKKMKQPESPFLPPTQEK